MSLSPLDAIALLVLLLFAVWGAMKGSLRQLASLAVLAAAFPLANRFGVRIEASVHKAVSVTDADATLIAWALVFALVLIAGGVLVALLAPLFGRLGHGERGLGALLGLLRGVVVLTILVHAALFVIPVDRAPAAVETLKASTTMTAAREVRRVLEGVLVVPPWLEARIQEVDAASTGAGTG